MLSTFHVKVDIGKLGTQTTGPITVEVIDSVVDYLALLKSIFDFHMIKKYLQANRETVKVLFDGLNGVTGPYGRAIFVEELGLGENSIQNCVPMPDFGGSHPDPNLTYAHDLVARVEKEKIAFGAASDGDGDRNMCACCPFGNLLEILIFHAGFTVQAHSLHRLTAWPLLQTGPILYRISRKAV